MYIGHYKATDSSKEFFSEKRAALDFPTQVSIGNKRYSLFSTYIASSPKQEANIISRAKEIGIDYGIKID